MDVKEDFVLDNSVTMTWCFPDEHDTYAEDVLKALPGAAAAVPSLWSLEVGNILLVGERRGRISQADTATFIGLLEGLPILIDGETSEHAMRASLDLARAQNLSVYDASYLELAMRRGLPIATLDGKLKAAAAAVGVAIYALPQP
ncbi:type II toxin-antitoxin system VapC family toxin [Tautonia sociabilis]|uniref:PIN domain-containing protein n=1 Tax=Tautonia sociabilis TaxID=2080755 RepID=A0A432MEP2_9BACT|nr:type II toxin-antitoxin system VapC family toxin [Tautonia sociabilis]RUL84020.1 PIN domain-containing protein [Tautonia sociabilis]